MILFLFLFLFFFSFSFFYFFNVKYGATPLYVAAENGYEKIVQILLEKGKPNVDLPAKVFFFWFVELAGFRSPFSFSFLIFPFLLTKRMEKLLFLSLLLKDMNKLFKFYWKKENQMLILHIRLFCWFCFSFFFFFFTFSFFYFFNVKDGLTPLFIAASNGHKQVVQILLEKGKPNVDLPNKVLLIVSFSFSFLFLIFLFFFYVKDGITPLFFAASNGHEQIVQILLRKGKANVDLANQVLVLFMFSFWICWFSFSIGGWRCVKFVFNFCFVFYFLKILFFFKSFFSRLGGPLFMLLLR